MKRNKYIYLWILMLSVSGMLCACRKGAQEQTKTDAVTESITPTEDTNKKEVITKVIEKPKNTNETSEKQPDKSDEITAVLETVSPVLVDSNIVETDLSEYFGDKNACVVIYDAYTKKCYEYHGDKTNERHSPCSTFKIIASLAAIKDGTVKSLQDKMGYSGKEYSNKSWNADLTMKEAFHESCVWYYRKLIDRIGQKNMKKLVDDLQYGNCDLSHWEGEHPKEYPDLSGFWLESSLLISPVEQVQVLYDIFREDSAYSEYLDEMKELMQVKECKYGTIYGKTGTGNGADRVCKDAWFTGFTIREDRTVYIAIHMDGYGEDSNVSGPVAKQIACEMLSEKTLAYLK